MPSTSLQLDPATATLWFGLPSSGSPGTDQLLTMAGNAACWGNVDDLKEMFVELQGLDLPAPTRQRIEDRLVGTVSSLWHESRHFFDLVLTNYGNFRTRRYVSIYANLSALVDELADDSGRLHCPIEHYADPVQRLVYGLAEPSAAVQGLLIDLIQRGEMIREDRAVMPTRVGPVAVGGTAQMEVTAYICQLIGMSEVFGTDRAVSALASMPLSASLGSDYLWVAGLSEIGVVDTFAAGSYRDRSVNMINSETVLPLFLGCLTTRHWGQAKAPGDSGLGSGYPAARLYALTSRLAPRWKVHRPDAVEAWAQVNAECAAIWGRTALEEIAHDLQLQQRFVDDIGQTHGESDVVYRWAADMLALRRDLVDLLGSKPELLVDQKEFPRLLSRVHVPSVNVTRHGVSELMPSHRRISAYLGEDGAGPPNYFASAVDLSDDTSRLGLRDFDAWATVVSSRAPLAKLLLNGRRQQVVLGPELVVAEATMATAGVQFEYAPTHELPVERLDRSLFWYFRDADEAICDLCSARVARGDGGELSPWLFRLHDPLASWAIAALDVDPNVSREKFIRDWTGWFACPSCLDQLQQLPIRFHSYLQEV